MKENCFSHINKPPIKSWYAIATVALTIFIAEVSIMILLAVAPLPHLNEYEYALIDALFLTITISSALYFFLFLPIKKPCFAVLIAVITFSVPGIAAPTLTVVGHADYVNGSPFVIRDGNPVALRAGEPVYPTDKIVTGDSGRVKLSMNDGSMVYIARKSQISIDHYTVKYGYRTSGTFDALRGKVRFVVAEVGGLDASFSVRTKSATISAKGTDFTVNEPKGFYPTQVMLHSGQIVADAKKGSHVMKPGTLILISAGGQTYVRKITHQDINTLGVPVKGFGGKIHAPKVKPPKIHVPKVKLPKINIRPPKINIRPPKINIHPPKIKPPKVKPPKP